MPIDDEIAAFIARTGRCDSVQISLDGSCAADTRLLSRGTGSFKGAIRGMRTLQRHGVNVAVRVTIHRYNVHDLDKIARLPAGRAGPAGRRAPTPPATWAHAARMRTSAADHATGRRRWRPPRLKAKYPGRISASAGPVGGSAHVARMEEARARGRAGITQPRAPHRAAAARTARLPSAPMA